jgi:molecular chaperone IbpA
MVSTMLDLFKDPFFIGIDRELDRFRHASEVAAKQSYPPYDLVRIDDDNYTLTLAVAGFAKQEIDISVENNTLTVTGEAISEDTDDIEYLHKGIAMRKFTRTFALGEYMEVVSAEINNGLLYISIRREIPEEKKPKQITIK